MANLEFCNPFVGQHVLQLISSKGPHPVGLLRRVLGDDLAVELVEFNKVRPSERKVAE